MIICPNCSQENKGGSKFCITCGKDLTKELKIEKDQIELKGAIIPSPALLENEKVLGEFSASFWDAGIIGSILRYKEKIIVTTHRIFYYSTRITGERLRLLFIEKAEGVKIESIYRVGFLLIGAGVLLLSIFAPQPSSKVGMFGQAVTSDGMPWYGRLFGIFIAVILILLARKTALIVATGNEKDSIELSITHLKKREA